MMDSRIATIEVGETQRVAYLHQSHVLAKEYPRLLRHVLGIPVLIQRAVAGSEESSPRFAHDEGSLQEWKS